MPSSSNSRLLPARLTGMAIVLTALVALIAEPILAQSRERPSRECRQEIQELCGQAGGQGGRQRLQAAQSRQRGQGGQRSGRQGGQGNRGQIRECLQERAGELSENCAAGFQQRSGANSRPFQATARVTRTVVYGEHQRQQIDIYEPEGGVDELPLVLFIHGGAWSAGSHQGVGGKPAHFNAAGYYFASTGYRLLPYAPVEQQAADVGAAIQALRGQASAIGFDSDRIVLMGHSSGAHLAALVAADPSYASGAFGAIKGVILLDAAGYDVAAHMAVAEPSSWQVYNNVFGREPARQAALSPSTHIGGPDAPNWLALYVEEREASRVQALAFAGALSEAGLEASAQSISGTDHNRLNRDLGTAAGAQQTGAIDAFLAKLFG